MYKFFGIVLMLLLSISCAFANQTVLKGFVEKVPDTFFGSWRVASYRVDTDSPISFKEKGVDLWNLSIENGVINLSNPFSGAMAEIKVEEARQNVKLVKKSYFPTITAEGQYQIGGRTFTSNYGYNFGGYLNFPTVNGMLIRNEIKELWNKLPIFRDSINKVGTIHIPLQQQLIAQALKDPDLTVQKMSKKCFYYRIDEN